MELKRLFIVDYRENGVSKHQCFETSIVGAATDAAIVTACHVHVGMHNDLDSVIEVFADMSAKELEEIAQTPKILFLPNRHLFVNVEEVKRCVKILKEA